MGRLYILEDNQLKNEKIIRSQSADFPYSTARSCLDEVRNTVCVPPYDENVLQQIREHNLKGSPSDIPLFYCRSGWDMDVRRNVCSVCGTVNSMAQLLYQLKIQAYT